MKEITDIYIDVRGGQCPIKSISLTIPSDASIEDWKEAFITILTHQTFHHETINSLFYNEDLESEMDLSY